MNKAADNLFCQWVRRNSLPNILTLSRLFMVPFVIWLISEGDFFWAFWLFVVAGFTDALDGLLAKMCHAVTETGAFLDPLADKALLVGVYLALGWAHELPTLLVILVVFRDILIVGGALLFHVVTDDLKMQPLFLSKINTFAQILLVVLILAQKGHIFDNSGLVSFVLTAVWGTTILSGLTYVIMWSKKAVNFGDSNR